MIPALLALVLFATPLAPVKSKPKPQKGQQARRNDQQISASYKAAHSEDPKARSAAFLTLSLQGVEKRLPDPEPNDPEPRCVELKSDGCKDKVFVCNRSVEIDAEETHYSNVERFIGFGATRDEAVEDVVSHLFSRAEKSGPDSTDTQCVVVFLDGCTHRAGMVCTTATEKIGATDNPAPKTEVFDLQFK